MRLAALAIVAFGTLALLPQSTRAQQAASQGDNAEIVVTAERMRTILHDFVADISEPPSNVNQLARWDHRICTGVFGLTNRDQAQFIADRIAQRAFGIGLDAGGPGCRANILIFLTPDADTLAQTLAREYRGLLGVRGESNRHTRGLAALDNFANSNRPVRWWHVADTVTSDGMRVGESSGNMMTASGTTIRVFNPSRLHATTRQDFSRVILIVDVRQAAGHRLDALSDYLAMVSLAQLSTSIETASYPSVLNLFSDQAVAGMTSWDLAYLDGLYHAPRDAYSTRVQQGRIADRMNNALSHPETTQPSAAPSP